MWFPSHVTSLTGQAQSIGYLQQKLAVVVQQLEASPQTNGDTTMGGTYDSMNPPNLAGGIGLRENSPDWARGGGRSPGWS